MTQTQENVSLEWYKKIIAVTNRKLCSGPFLEQLEKLCCLRPKAIILRERDLQAEEYQTLGRQVQQLCKRYQVLCIYHSFVQEAIKNQVKNIHLPLWKLREIKEEEKKVFELLGTSIHSVEEAKEAQRIGADYLIAGHIYHTDCKKGVPPRGLPFLKAVCDAVQIPVYAIGGIQLQQKQIQDVLECGAEGICMMSELMKL